MPHSQVISNLGNKGLHQTSEAAPQRQKRGREQEAEPSSQQDSEQPPSKRPRTSPSSYTADGTSESNTGPIHYWIQNGRWRKEYFEQDSQVWDDFERGKSPEEFEERDWLQEHCLMEPLRPMQGFEHLRHVIARKRSSNSSNSLGRKDSESSPRTPSDQLPRGVNSAQYGNTDYEFSLERKGSYMREYKEGCKQEHLKELLCSEQTVPQDTLFRDDLFSKTCQNIRNRNETMIIRDIGSLIVPSAQTLATYGATDLNNLFECVNEGWNRVIPFHGTRPQPDYSVGFGWSAFTEEQLKKLTFFVGEIESKAHAYFMATTRMFFPFLTCEVKCRAADLDVADRQNAHSMTVAIRALVELFKLVGREGELDREILAFSISHNDSSVRLYGHYPVIEGDKITFYRHSIHDISFTRLDGREKWTAYKFIRNVYDIWMPSLYKRICSAIDDIPADINVALSQSAHFSQATPQSLQQSDAGSTLSGEYSELSLRASQEVTSNSSFTQAAEPVSKKPKK